MKRKAIEAIARRSGAWWAIEVPEYPGVFSQARRIDQVPVMAADALTAWLEREVLPDEIYVEAHPEGDLDEIFAAANERRRIAETARSEAQSATRNAIVAGVRAGLPLRDIGALLDVSHQRIAAIARELQDA